MAHDLERLKEEGERLELVEHLLGGLDDFSDHAAKEWRDEAKDRLNAFRSGELDTVPLADVVGASPRPTPLPASLLGAVSSAARRSS